MDQMEKYIIKGGNPLVGEVKVSGSKNVAIKVVIASLLTDEEVILENMPLITDLKILLEIIRELGVSVTIDGHTVKIHAKELFHYQIPLEAGARIRTSSMLIAPLLARVKKAFIPNPGGCRIGARPIDRIILGLEKMGAVVSYDSQDGYFHAHTEGLRGTTYRFEKNSHTGTETLIMAAVLAKGKTILENAALEPEIDDLIAILIQMGAKIIREGRTITIDGVEKLTGTHFTIMPDRNEVVTLAIAAYITNGDISVLNADEKTIETFLQKLTEAKANWEEGKHGGIRFCGGKLQAVDVTTAPHPGFMTDWQAPWTVLMTRAHGSAIVHEAVYENRFSYVDELKKMGANLELFNPDVVDPKSFYNFNWEDEKDHYSHAVRVTGPTTLHNAVLTVSDLRAGATLVLAALAAKGVSVVYGINQIDRGYEDFEGRLKQLGAEIKRLEGVI